MPGGLTSRRYAGWLAGAGRVALRASGDCDVQVDYDGRLTAHLPLATRLLMVKADGSVLVHSDGGSYKPLNWMSPPCAMAEVEPEGHEVPQGVTARLGGAARQVRGPAAGLRCTRCCTTPRHELGVDPGLVKDGVEAHLQRLLAEHIRTLGDGLHAWSGAST